MGLACGSKWISSSINSLGTPGILAGFHTKMSLFSWMNLMSVSSYLESKVLSMCATLEDSFVGNGTCLLSVSSG
jgi:hypothetical protein